MTTKTFLSIVASLFTIVATAIGLYFLRDDSPQVRQEVGTGIATTGTISGGNITITGNDSRAQSTSELRDHATVAAESCRSLASVVSKLPTRPTSIPPGMGFALPPTLYPPEHLAQLVSEQEFRNLTDQFKRTQVPYGSLFGSLMILDTMRKNGTDPSTAPGMDQHYALLQSHRSESEKSLSDLCSNWERMRTL